MVILTETGNSSTTGDLWHQRFAMELPLGTGKDKLPLSGPSLLSLPLFQGLQAVRIPAGSYRGGTVSNRGLTAGRESSRPRPLPGHGSRTHSGTLQRRSFAGDLSSGLLFLLYAGQQVEIPTRRWEENKWKDIESRKDKGQNKLSDNQCI